MNLLWAKRRWEIRATPKDDSLLAHKLAEKWNERPDRFASRRTAEGYARLHAQSWALPLDFWVIDRKDTDGRRARAVG